MNSAQQKEIERAKAWAAEQLAKRKGTKRIKLDVSLWQLDQLNVNELVEWAEHLRDQVPEPFREASMVVYEAGGGEYSGSLEAYYDRPETDADRETDRHYQDLKAIAERGTRK